MIRGKKILSLALALTLLVSAAPVRAAGGAALPTAATAEATQQTGGRFAMPALELPAKQAILIEQETGQVLYEKNPDDRVPIASITKVMTLLLTFEAIDAGKISLDDLVPVSEHAYSMGGSQIWLEPGEQFTLDEMIRAICVASANDAAVAVAELVGGSEPVFAEMMTKRAQELGMENTSFKNACGLDTEGHFSSARDVAIMSRELLKNYPQITEYTTIWTDSLRGGATQLVNTNKLLNRYEGMTGLKTGTTLGAGVCISASATRDGLSLIAVVLGSSSSEERFEAATTMLDYGFANFEMAAPPLPEEFPTILPVTGGAQRQVTLTYPETGNLLLKKGESAGLTLEVELPESVAAPLAQGDQLGTVRALVGGEEIASWPVTAAQSVEQMTFSIGFGLLFDALTGL